MNKVTKETIIASEAEITLDSIFKDISKVLQSAEKIDAVFMCFSIKEAGEELVPVYSRGNAFDLLELATRSVPVNAERVGITCVKILTGRIEAKKDGK